MELSKEMLDAAQDENVALLEMLLVENPVSDSALTAGRIRFERALNLIQATEPDQQAIDSVKIAYELYLGALDRRFDVMMAPTPNSVWFLDVYKTSYSDLTTSIKNFIVSSQRILDAQVLQLKDDANRAIMPGIIALSVAILIILMFFYFIDTYYLTPILRINRGLQNSLRSRIPFDVNMEGRDEVYQLRENIKALTEQLRSKKSES